MSQLLVKHDADGTIVDWWYEHDHDYVPGDDELVVDVDHRDLHRLRVDVDEGVLVDDPGFVEVPSRKELHAALQGLRDDDPVARRRVSQALKSEFLDARASGDVQGMLDVLYEVVTGEEP